MTTAMFIFTSNNRTPQSLRRHSCFVLFCFTTKANYCWKILIISDMLIISPFFWKFLLMKDHVFVLFCLQQKENIDHFRYACFQTVLLKVFTFVVLFFYCFFLFFYYCFVLQQKLTFAGKYWPFQICLEFSGPSNGMFISCFILVCHSWFPARVDCRAPKLTPTLGLSLIVWLSNHLF